MKRGLISRMLAPGVVLITLGTVTAFLLIPVTSKNPPLVNPRSHMTTLINATRAYANEYKSLPHGESQTILKALQGNNQRQIIFLDRHESIHIDPWGTPYRMTIEKEIVTVSSAGPDGLWDTPDDILLQKHISIGSADDNDSTPTPHITRDSQ